MYPPEVRYRVKSFAQEGGVVIPSKAAKGAVGDRTFLTLRQAAELLHVSGAYLRASSCPKVLLPGNGPRNKALIRYVTDDLKEWATAPRRHTSHSEGQSA